MLLVTLGARWLESILADKIIIQAGEGMIRVFQDF